MIVERRTGIMQVVHREEMTRRDKELEECDISYLFDLDFDTGDSGEPEFTIDAKEYGNAARFINHSVSDVLSFFCYRNARLL